MLSVDAVAVDIGDGAAAVDGIGGGAAVDGFDVV